MPTSLKISKKYVAYHLRWQLGWFVFTPILYILIDYFKFPLWSSMIIAQFIGACIFWYVDRLIFKNNQSIKN